MRGRWDWEEGLDGCDCRGGATGRTGCRSAAAACPRRGGAAAVKVMVVGGGGRDDGGGGGGRRCGTGRAAGTGRRACGRRRRDRTERRVGVAPDFRRRLTPCARWYIFREKVNGEVGGTYNVCVCV